MEDIETFVISASCVCWLDSLRSTIPYGEGGTLKMVEEINECIMLILNECMKCQSTITSQ